MMKFYLNVFAMALLSSAGFAWDGTDSDNGENVEIQRGQLVRTGNDIELYNQDKGEYQNYTVDDIDRTGSSVQIQATDEDGESHTFDMEDN